MKDYIKTGSDKELIGHAQSLYDSIYNVECFGTKDLIALDLIENELVRRGYSLDEEHQLKVAYVRDSKTECRVNKTSARRDSTA
jgi:hypothetical protein